MYATIEQANAAVIARIREARPHWQDVDLAHRLIPPLAEGRKLLHAGPPVTWQEMSGPVRGACIGACLFEGWAQDEQQALALLEQGEIEFIPCHSVSAVGPMGGITSAHMPMVVVRNTVHGNYAYCNMNEGIGKVMRFGAYGEDVQQRLRWMRDSLAPVLKAVLATLEEGIDLTALMAQAISMGDEFHQRNIAASALLMRRLAPEISLLPRDKAELAQVMQFLSITDQFFLNLAMAYCKAAMDAGAEIEQGTIVTVMTRNGKNFGIKISGMGDRWFTAPVNTPEGLFFSGFSQADANPDIGDSAITETFGIGGAAMVAAPGVTRFVGASGGMSAATDISEEMAEIYLERNMMLQIPTWDFQGACLGLDARRVVETGITPLINTGIAHREAGVGQIGAGTVRAPLGCFEKSIEALADKLGITAQANGGAYGHYRAGRQPPCDARLRRAALRRQLQQRDQFPDGTRAAADAAPRRQRPEPDGVAARRAGFRSRAACGAVRRALRLLRRRHHVGWAPGAARRRGAGSGADIACGHCRSAADGGIAALHGAVRVTRRAGPIGEAAVNAGAGRAGAGFLPLAAGRHGRLAPDVGQGAGADAEQRRHLARPAAERAPRQPHSGRRAGAVFRPYPPAGRADHAGERALPALCRAGRVRHAAAGVGAGAAGAWRRIGGGGGGAEPGALFGSGHAAGRVAGGDDD